MSIYKLNETFNIAQWDDSGIDWDEIPDDAIKDDLKTGELNNFFGKKHTKETRKRLSQALKEYSAKYGNSFKGKKHTAEAREQMKINHRGMTGKKHKLETIQKMKGNTNAAGGKGRPKTKEWKKKVSLSMTGTKRPPFSDEWKENLSKAQRNRKVETCPHCGKSGTHNMKRYHFDNCKER